MEALAAQELPVRKKALPAVAKPWERQPEDTDLWWARFLPYLAMGPKRSVSITAMGRPNAYPIPAHWPIQAKQLHWKARAEAFDAAALKDPSLIEKLNDLLTASATTILKAMRNKVDQMGVNPRDVTKALLAEGYRAAPPVEYEDEAPKVKIRQRLPEEDREPAPELVFPTRPIVREI